MHVHTGTDKKISFKIFSFRRVVCSRQGESTSEDKVRVFYAIKLYFTDFGFFSASFILVSFKFGRPITLQSTLPLILISSETENHINSHHTQVMYTQIFHL